MPGLPPPSRLNSARQGGRPESVRGSTIRINMNSNGPLATPETRKGYWWRVCDRCSGGRSWPWRSRPFTSINWRWNARGFSFRLRCMKRTCSMMRSPSWMAGKSPAANNISLGSHRLIIKQPKAETFSTNFFAWYGRHDLGRLDLRRAMGTLVMTADPAAKMITISGPEFSLTFNNSTGTNAGHSDGHLHRQCTICSPCRMCGISR